MPRPWRPGAASIPPAGRGRQRTRRRAGGVLVLAACMRVQHDRTCHADRSTAPPLLRWSRR